MTNLSIEKLDVKGKMCPMPVAYTKRKLASLAPGELLEVIGEGELELDNIQRWAINNGHQVVEATKSEAEFKLVIKKC